DAVEDDVVSLGPFRGEIYQVVDRHSTRRDASDFSTDEAIVIRTGRNNSVARPRRDYLERQHLRVRAGIRRAVWHGRETRRAWRHPHAFSREARVADTGGLNSDPVHVVAAFCRQRKCAKSRASEI